MNSWTIIQNFDYHSAISLKLLLYINFPNRSSDQDFKNLILLISQGKNQYLIKFIL